MVGALLAACSRRGVQLLSRSHVSRIVVADVDCVKSARALERQILRTLSAVEAVAMNPIEILTRVIFVSARAKQLFERRGSGETAGA